MRFRLREKDTKGKRLESYAEVCGVAAYGFYVKQAVDT